MWGEERRVKRRLLRELVDENVELKAGGRSRPRRRRSRLPWAVKALGLAVAPAALLASSLVLSGAVDPGRWPTARADDAPAAPAPALRKAGTAAGDEAALPGGGAVALRARLEADLAVDLLADGASAAGLPTGPAAAAGTDLAAADLATAPAPALPALATRALEGDVFPLAVRRIVLDPGHGGANTGTRTPSGLEEKFLTLDIARRLRETLETHRFEVLMTREGDQAVTLAQRAAFANRERADIFVSIHVNWLEGVRAGGIETYYLGLTDDPFLTRLAANENVESGHTLAEMRDLFDRIYEGVLQDKSRALAREIHGSLFGSLRRVNPQLADRGVKTAPLLVLVDTEMPAILAEVAALSSEAEAAMLERPLYRDYIADSLATGIVAYAESVGGRTKTGSSSHLPSSP